MEQDSSETQFQTTITDQKPTFKLPAFDENLVIDNMDLLKSLCVCVPNFEDAEYLDEDFYARLINMSVCGPLGSRAESVDVETRPYYMARISRTDMEEYMWILFGKELPAYEPSLQEMQEKDGNFYYEGGYYYIGWFDPPDIIYTYEGCQPMDNGNLTVEFSMSEAVNGRSVIMELAPMDNENGFIIINREINNTSPLHVY